MPEHDAPWTQGPWHFVNGNLRRVTAASHPSVMNSVSICGVHRIGRFIGKENEAEQVANGRLIAAAPSLYKALVRLLECQEQSLRGGCMPADFGLAREGARGALALARGDTNG